MIEIERRFWQKVQKQPGDGCWLWTGKKRAGYGRVYASSYLSVHRVAWEFRLPLQIDPSRTQGASGIRRARS